jgi:hypothetical protein
VNKCTIYTNVDDVAGDDEFVDGLVAELYKHSKYIAHESGGTLADFLDEWEDKHPNYDADKDGIPPGAPYDKIPVIMWQDDFENPKMSSDDRIVEAINCSLSNGGKVTFRIDEDDDLELLGRYESSYRATSSKVSASNVIWNRIWSAINWIWD